MNKIKRIFIIILGISLFSGCTENNDYEIGYNDGYNYIGTEEIKVVSQAEQDGYFDGLYDSGYDDGFNNRKPRHLIDSPVETEAYMQGYKDGKKDQ